MITTTSWVLGVSEISLSENSETREINENIYIDLDAVGDLVSITIEHAKSRASLPDVVVEQFDQGVA